MTLMTSEFVVRFVQKYRQRLRPAALRHCTVMSRNSETQKWIQYVVAEALSREN